jgi:hypothetical protein
MKINYIQEIAEFSPILADADYIDVKTIESTRTLREFSAALIGYQPGWVTFLYRVRAGFVRLLGMKQGGIPKPPRLDPAEVPMIPGEKFAFFTVVAAKEDAFLLAEASESHLTAVIGIVCEPLDKHRRRFYVVTVVHYNHWIGPIYFNIIRPFHHLVIGAMTRAGAFG